jgi:flagellar protein FlaJ
MNVDLDKSYKLMRRRFILKYMNISYIFGAYLDRMTFKNLSKSLYQADVEMTPGMFLSVCFLTGGIVGILAFSISDLAFTFYMDTPLAVPLSILIGVVSFGAILAGFYFSVMNKVSAKKIDIDRELPFALSYMSIMSSAGSTPLKVLSALSIQGYGSISKELQKMGYRVYFLGEDAVTAMNNLANNTPSNSFRDICLELGNIIHSGTGMMEFLSDKSQDLIDMRRIILKDFMDQLSLFSEVYLLISMANILAVIAIPLVGIFNVKLGFLDANALFMLFAYIMLPLANILFLAVLEVKYSSMP